MKKFAYLLIALTALVFSGALAQEEADPASPEVPASLTTAFYAFYPTENSSISGMVQVTEDLDMGARVSVTALGTEAGVMYPAHFHAGDCGSGGDIIYPLEGLAGGDQSPVSNIDATVEEIINSNLYVNIHDPNDMSVILACGEVGMGANEQWQ